MSQKEFQSPSINSIDYFDDGELPEWDYDVPAFVLPDSDEAAWMDWADEKRGKILDDTNG